MSRTDQQKQSEGFLYKYLYECVRSGKEKRLKLGGGLRLAFKPGLLTASRKEVQPSGTEIVVLKNALKRAIMAARFQTKAPEIEVSGLLRWEDKGLLGYRLTWEQANE